MELMDGIQVLSESTKCTAGGDAIFLGVCFGAIALMLLCCFVYSIIKHESSLAISVFFIGCVLISSICFGAYTTRESYQEYKVTLSDNIKLKELNERYKIIDQEGQIYTIQENKIK